jgi:alpha-ketoglutarate-dependent taurine dioxygenase
VYVPGPLEPIVFPEEREARLSFWLFADLVPQPPFRYEHNWQVGDLLMWDNCSVQHLATVDYQWPEHRRFMHRITVGGSAPY